MSAHAPGGGDIKATGQLKLSADGAPIRYDWSAEAQKKATGTVDFVSGTAKCSADLGAASPLRKDFTFTSPLVAVLDNNLYYQFGVLARVYDWKAGGKQTFPVLIPQDMVPGSISVESLGPQQAGNAEIRSPARQLPGPGNHGVRGRQPPPDAARSALLERRDRTGINAAVVQTPNGIRVATGPNSPLFWIMLRGFQGQYLSRHALPQTRGYGAVVSGEWKAEGMLPLRRSIALCVLLGALIFGWLWWRNVSSRQLQSETTGPTINKQPVLFTNRTFDPAAPPPEMPPLNPGEYAECDSNFLSSAKVGGETRQTDATHGTVTITRIKVTLQLNIAIWVAGRRIAACDRT